MREMEKSHQQHKMIRKKLEKSISRTASMLTNTARIAGCVGIGVLGAAIDGPVIVSIAFAKSPIYIYKGFKVTFQAEYGLAVTGAMAFIWPVRVIGELGASVIYSLGKGFKGGVVAYQQKSFTCGFNHIISAISEYDEYSNDVVLLREGSCLPRPAYRKRNDQEEKDGLIKIVKKSDSRVVVAEEEMNLQGLMEFMSSTERINNRLKELGVEKRLRVEAVALIILWYLEESFESGCGAGNLEGPEEHYYDALEILGQQMSDARLRKEEFEVLERLVLRKETNVMNEKMEVMEIIRRATLEGFGRRIRGIAGFLSADARFRRGSSFWWPKAVGLPAKLWNIPFGVNGIFLIPQMIY